MRINLFIVLLFLLFLSVRVYSAPSIAEAKLFTDGTSVSLSSKVVTYTSPDFFYVQEPDRSGGIRIKKDEHGLKRGMLVSLQGKIFTNENYERYIMASTITEEGNTVIYPLSIRNIDFGGGNWNYNPATGAGVQGYNDSAALNNIGLWTEITGRAKSVNPDRFALNDGSSIEVKVEMTGVGLLVAEGDFVRVTGISSSGRTNTGERTRLLLCSDDDRLTHITLNSLEKRTLLRNNAPTAFHAGHLHIDKDGKPVVWAATNGLLFKSEDQGETWGAPTGQSQPPRFSFFSFDGGLGIEGLFVASDGTIFVTAGTTQRLYQSKYPHDGTNFGHTRIDDNSGRAFAFPAIAGGYSGGAPNQWSFWEIEYPWEAVGGLQTGDIIVGHYHRSSALRAFIYVLRKNSNGVYEINSDNKGFPVVGGSIGDPFAAWNQAQALRIRHIHHITMGMDGWLYFSTGDSENWGDGKDSYRFVRMQPGGTGWEDLSGPGYGYTALHLLPDGKIVVGNDYADFGVGHSQVIDIWDGPVRWKRVYSPEDPDMDWPVWDIVRVEADQRMFASIQRPGNPVYAGRARAALLGSGNKGLNWHVLLVSSPSANQPGWADVDRIFHGRRRTIPEQFYRLIIQTQPESNTDGRYYLYRL